jgi:hypothetical protein
MTRRTRNKIAYIASAALRVLPLIPASAQDLEPRVEES